VSVRFGQRRGRMVIFLEREIGDPPIGGATTSTAVHGRSRFTTVDGGPPPVVRHAAPPPRGGVGELA